MGSAGRVKENFGLVHNRCDPVWDLTEEQPERIVWGSVRVKPFPARSSHACDGKEVMKKIQVAAFLALVALCFHSRAGGEKSIPSGKGPTGEASATTVKLPGLTVDMEKKAVTGTGRVCLTSGILEYLVVAKGGKDYESVIEMSVRPSDLHAALLMTGAVPGAMPQEFKGDGKGDLPGAKKKSEAGRFVIFVEWAEGGKTVRVKAEKLLYDRDKDEAGRDFVWAFTGSYFYRDREGKEYYMADEGKSIVGIWYDGSALLNLAEKSKNPYRGDDFGFEVNTKKIPERGTPVKIIFQHIERKGEP